LNKEADKTSLHHPIKSKNQFTHRGGESEMVLTAIE